MSRRRRWADLSTGQRVWFLGASTLQVGLAAVAWTDLARRPQEGVRGRKPLWALAIGVNFVGPIAYLLFGRAHRPERTGVDVAPDSTTDTGVDAR